MFQYGVVSEFMASTATQSALRGLDMQIEPSFDLGLRHALQNGLLIARGVPLEEEEDRRTEILEDLSGILSEAKRGSKAVQDRHVVIRLSDRAALKQFSLFSRYLSGDLSERLSQAADAVTAFSKGDEPARPLKDELISLFSELLEALERERDLAPLERPREFVYN